eukprot:2797371-Karenia_brevis.AAC.1
MCIRDSLGRAADAHGRCHFIRTLGRLRVRARKSCGTKNESVSGSEIRRDTVGPAGAQIPQALRWAQAGARQIVLHPW